MSAAAGQLERTDDAVQWSTRATELLPGNVEAWINLGHARYQQGQFSESETAYRRAGEIEPANPRAGLGVAKSLAAQNGRQDEALRIIEPIVNSGYDNDVEALDTLGVCYANAGRRDDAVAVFDRIIARQPDYEFAYLRIARIFAEQGDYQQAIDYLNRAKAATGDVLAVLSELTRVYHGYGMPHIAIQTCDEALKLDPGNFNARFFRALSLSDYTKHEEALAALQELESDTPVEHLDEHRLLDIAKAGIHEQLGNNDTAWELVHSYLEQQGSIPGGVISVLARLCRRYDECERTIGLINELLAGGDLSSVARRDVLFSLAKLLDRQKDYDAAFKHVREANELVPYRYDHHDYISYIDRLTAPAITDLIADIPLQDEVAHDVRPVFIVGMPRSGTSLVEQIISSHPQAFGGGERHEMASISQNLPGWSKGQPYPECLGGMTPDMQQELARGYAEFVKTLPAGTSVMTDKMPENYQHLALIRLLFPEARIIHCVRDPRDTCLSCYFQQFIGYHDYAYGLANLGNHYREYKRMMNHYRDEIGFPMLEVSYEELVGNTEKVSREMIEYCGLPWDERCLRFYESDRVVRTASYEQVRQPIYTRSVGRWRHYEAHLGPLLEALES